MGILFWTCRVCACAVAVLALGGCEPAGGGRPVAGMPCSEYLDAVCGEDQRPDLLCLATGSSAGTVEFQWMPLPVGPPLVALDQEPWRREDCKCEPDVDGGTRARCSRVKELVNEGVACVAPTNGSAGGGPLSVDKPVTVQVKLNRSCLPGCAERLDHWCLIYQEGNSLRVMSSGAYKEPLDRGPCNTICAYLTADCSSAALAAGEYSLSLGASTSSFTVPSEVPPCFETFRRY